MSPLRTVAVLVVFLGLAALEVFNGFGRISSLRDARHRELVQQVRRDHDELARRLTAMLEDGRRRAMFLAALPDAHAGLAGFLTAFEDVDGLAHLTADGVVLASLSRGDDGRSLGPAHPTELAAWLDGLPRPPRAGVFVGALDPDAPGDPVPPRCLAPTPASAAAPDPDAPSGWLLLTLSPAPFLEALTAFRPLDMSASRLVPAADAPASPAAEGGLHLTTPLEGSPPLVLATELPRDAFDRAMEPLRREYAWILLPMLGVTLALALIGAVVLRLSQRSFRLRETEHYLRWIRRVTDRYRALMEGAADMILIVAPDGALREANAAARAALGLADDGAPAPGSPRTAAPHGLAELFAADDRPRLERALRQAVDTPGRPVALNGLRLAPVGDPEVAVDGHFASVDLGDEHVVEVSLRDVTHQRAIERQLQTAERLGSLGMLTAGVAHEINNPLEGIGNYLTLLERPDLDEAGRTRYVERVRRGFGRIRDIVQDLLSFARPSLDTGRADLAAVVDAALGMATYSKDLRGMQVRREGLDAPLEAAGDAGRLEQVVLNLLLNAARAMRGQGEIVVRGTRLHGDDGEQVELEVSDRGPGIPEADLDRIFDPFFSGHGGTGLGLSVSFGIVSAHAGRLSATNRPGGGATFTLRLPAAPPPSPENAP